MDIFKIILHFRCFQIISIISLFPCGYLTSSTENSTETALKSKETDAKNGSLPLYNGPFYSLKSIVQILTSDQYKDSNLARRLISIYDNYCKPREGKKIPKERHPFVVVEGINKRNRRLVTERLGRSLGAQLLITTPACLRRLEVDCKTDLVMNKVFYGLSYYITSYDIAERLEKAPIILSGYWTEQATYYLVKDFQQQLPANNSKLYHFPKDLLAPDMLFFLNSGQNRVKLSGRYQERNRLIIQNYRRLKGVEMYELNAEVINHKIILLLRRVIKKRIGYKFKHLQYL